MLLPLSLQVKRQPQELDVEETGSSYAENARLKASAAALASFVNCSVMGSIPAVLVKTEASAFLPSMATSSCGKKKATLAECVLFFAKSLTDFNDERRQVCRQCEFGVEK